MEGNQPRRFHLDDNGRPNQDLQDYQKGRDNKRPADLDWGVLRPPEEESGDEEEECRKRGEHPVRVFGDGSQLGRRKKLPLTKGVVLAEIAPTLSPETSRCYIGSDNKQREERGSREKKESSFALHERLGFQIPVLKCSKPSSRGFPVSSSAPPVGRRQ